MHHSINAKLDGKREFLCLFRGGRSLWESSNIDIHITLEGKTDHHQLISGLIDIGHIG